jgi:carbon-monoxide dehydrogenase medium subunit
MVDMQVFQPETLEETFQLLEQWGDDCKIIAGGTAMVLMLKSGLISPGAMISLGRLEGMADIHHEASVGLRIGALATLRAGEISPVVRQANPTLAATFGEVANVRVRNAATVGGNLSEADYASDPPTTLVAMRGSAIAKSSRGDREIPLTEFFVDYYETALESDEVLTHLVVPELSSAAHSSYLKYVTRSSEDRPCIGVAAVVELNPDVTCKDLRVVVGAVSGQPLEVESAEAIAVGETLTAQLIRDIADAYADAIDPLDDLRGSKWYRTQMIRVFVRRAIEEALADGPGLPS